MTQITNIAMPRGDGIDFMLSITQGASQAPVISHVVYDSNQTFSADLQRKMGGVHAHGVVLEVSSPDQLNVPNVCLFTGKNFTGDAACFDVGASGELPEPMKSKFQSLLPRNAGIWVYRERYGDAAGELLDWMVDDLDSVL